VQIPETRYARSGEVWIAYQVHGDGPFDVVFHPGFVSHGLIPPGLPYSNSRNSSTSGG
jgi:hypothetical protein